MDDQACPRCGTPHELLQEYCLECGLRLPLDRGIVPAVRGAWRLEGSPHPGGRVWVVLVLLAVAALATVAAILASDDSASAVRTIVATESIPATTAAALTETTPTVTAPTTTAPSQTGATTTTQRPPQTAPVEWPEGRSGHTVV